MSPTTRRCTPNLVLQPEQIWSDQKWGWVVLMQSELATAVLLEWVAYGSYQLDEVASIPRRQWAILRILQRMPAHRRETRSIAHYVNASRSSVSAELRKMRLRGLVRSVRSKEDKRIVLFTLTSAGTRTLSRDPLHLVADTIAGLPKDERELFERSVQEIALRLLEELGGGSEKNTSVGGRSGTK